MIGDLAALACAFCFAFCSLAFAEAGRKIGSLLVNVLRISLACLLLLLAHQLILGSPWPTQVQGAPLYWLVASGVVGLALGDLAYFQALAVIGPRLGTLLMSTFPVFTLLGQGLLRGAWPGAEQVAWMLLIMVGVYLVLSRGGHETERAQHHGLGRRRFLLAVLAGLLGAVGQGLGLVLIKAGEQAGLAQAGGEPLPSLSLTLIRMVAGCLLMLPIVVGRLGPRRLLAFRPPRRALLFLLVGTATGPVLGVWLSTVAVQQGDESRAAVLIALVPVLMIPIEGLRLGRWPGALGWLGTLCAFVGAAALMGF